MRWNSHEITEKIIRRAKLQRQKDMERKRKILAIASSAACLAVVVGLAFLIPSTTGSLVTETSNALSGTLLAGSTIGGYVLMGMAGFMLGSAVTFFCIREQRKE